ncbi:MAG TPA: ATP synthase F1 subunit epsilon [Candidatus Hydrogenedentes bacterium]|nr:ATP synthase F1 subunit epsilon [Candidatus Hydrogenedentota bacterium]HOS02438.1 ATP synthase F1 subunit epsilon [Candidatus Hydrogenedentota bacterium]
MTSENKDWIALELAAPGRPLIVRETAGVTLPGVNGLFMALPGHAALLSLLEVGVVEAHLADGKTERFFVNQGYAEVLNDKVVILSQDIAPGEEIDPQRAEEAKQRAEERLKQHGNVDVARAEYALRRALARLQAHRAGAAL